MLGPVTNQAWRIGMIFMEADVRASSSGDVAHLINGLAGNDAKPCVDCGDRSAGGGTGAFVA